MKYVMNDELQSQVDDNVFIFILEYRYDVL
jgi:hypothetical protein